MTKRFYVRFGDLPEHEQSMSYQTEEPEPGVSVHSAVMLDGKTHTLLPKDPRWRLLDYGSPCAKQIGIDDN